MKNKYCTLLEFTLTKKYSLFSLIKEGLADNFGWDKVLYNLEPKKRYEVIIVGAGGHGLATAYYLSKNHNVKDIAVIEKGWLRQQRLGVEPSRHQLTPESSTNKK